MRTGIGPVKVVEYLEDSISEELLSKFPLNNSTSSSSYSDPTLDFNYSESSIWSPLVKPHLSPLHHSLLLHSYEESKKKSTMIVQNINFGFKNLLKQSSNKRIKIKKGSSELFKLSPAPKKNWKNILKAGSKRFKKTLRKREHNSHISLTNCF